MDFISLDDSISKPAVDSSFKQNNAAGGDVSQNVRIECRFDHRSKKMEHAAYLPTGLEWRNFGREIDKVLQNHGGIVKRA
jgi:hypothetical protein